MFCAISGEVPTDPVVSRVSGHVYERRLIEKYLESEDKCPVTGEPMNAADLITVKANQAARPRPITATSIPGLLSHFQNEWDAVMLETYTLKQHLDATRKELSQVLYQHDAACRVIARLTRERDEARAMLSQRQQYTATSSAAQAAGERMDEDTPALTEITEAVVGQLMAKGKELSKTRKKRPIPATLATADAISAYQCKSSSTPHSSSKQAVNCVDVHPVETAVTVSGGTDKEAIIYNHDASRVLCSLSGHSKKVTAVKFHPDPSKPVVLTASADKTAKIWSSTGTATDLAYEERGSISHGADVVGLSVHPTGDYFVSASKNATWAFNSIEYGTTLKSVTNSDLAKEYTCINFHPDGLIVGIGDSSNTVRMWDMKTQNLITTFEGHEDTVTSIDFSENGYYMASTSKDGTCRLWDLRKSHKKGESVNIKTLELGRAGHAVKFDYSGTFLSIGAGSELKVQTVKTWNTLATLTDHTKDINDIALVKDATVIYSVSSDRSIRRWGQ